MFAVTLTLNTATQYFHWTFWFMMIYHQTRFGWKRIISSEDVVKTVAFWLYTSLWPWPWRQQPNCFAWHGCLWWRITITSLVQKIEQFRKHNPNKQLKFWTFAVSLTLNTAIQYFHWTLWLTMICHHTEFGCKRIISSEDIVETVIFWLYKPLLWLWPWRQQTHVFGMTLWPRMMHCHTKFAYKVSSSKISSGQKLERRTTIHSDLSVLRLTLLQKWWGGVLPWRSNIHLNEQIPEFPLSNNALTLMRSEVMRSEVL